MHLHSLLPRPLNPQAGAESPSILSALLSGFHLNRKQARALGWRVVLRNGAEKERPGLTALLRGRFSQGYL